MTKPTDLYAGNTSAARRGSGPSRLRRRQPIGAAGGGALLAVLALVLVASTPAPSHAEAIVSRNLWAPRDTAAESPSSEIDQAILDGWPLYRTQRGQEAYNHTMATLEATNASPPDARAFAGCSDLRCPLSLPRLSAEGWLPAGRLWLSPTSYVLFVRSPRDGEDSTFPRRSRARMRYFIYHEFHNSTRNTDPYDTISAHRGSVFVPFHMSKPQTDAAGYRFVAIVQVAPHDVESRHATSHGHAGPGIEVANNYSDRIDTLQAYAGIVIALIVKAAEPQLEVVHHRGQEGLPMLRAYHNRRRALQHTPRADPSALPYVAATRQRIASAAASLRGLIRLGDGQAVAVAALPLETSWPPFAIPTPQLAIRPPRPQLVTFRPAPPVAHASLLTIEDLLQRIFDEQRATDRARNCAIGWSPTCAQ